MKKLEKFSIITLVASLIISVVTGVPHAKQKQRPEIKYYSNNTQQQSATTQQPVQEDQQDQHNNQTKNNNK